MIRMVLSMMLLACSAFGAASKPVQFQPLRDGVIQFVTPDQNVGCTYIPFDGASGIDTGQNSSELHCYRLREAQVAVSLGVKGKARKLIVKRALNCCSGGNVLAFGKHWSAGGYSCQSRRLKLRCTFGSHGFVISNKAISRF